jgi:single-stranded DNA-specific DHH superfamily exonuclease
MATMDDKMEESSQDVVFVTREDHAAPGSKSIFSRNISYYCGTHVGLMVPDPVEDRDIVQVILNPLDIVPASEVEPGWAKPETEGSSDT